MSWYLSVLKNYVGFSGRARRKEFWMFYLFNAIAIAILYMPFIVTQETSLVFIVPVYLLAVFLPTLAVIVRRLHDTGKSGWWYLITFIPFGGIVLLVFMCMDSQSGPNQYGPNPKGA